MTSWGMVLVQLIDTRQYYAHIRVEVTSPLPSQVLASRCKADPVCVRLQVHGDVFRPPVHASLLATFVGTGVQVLCCVGDCEGVLWAREKFALLQGC